VWTANVKVEARDTLSTVVALWCPSQRVVNGGFVSSALAANLAFGQEDFGPSKR
jgi:hypothetical protein